MQRAITLVRISLLTVSLLATHAAQAGSLVLADQGNNYAGDGQSWPNLLTPAGTPQTLPFAIDIGGGPALLTFTTQSDGSIQFGNGNFIDVAFNRFGWTPPTSISNDRGRLDPSLLDKTLAPNFSADPNVAGLDAYRFMWNGVCPTISPNCASPFAFEAVIYDLAPEVFALQFNYGSLAFPLDTTNPIPGLVGFTLDGNIVPPGNGAIDSNQPDYCFNNGVAHQFSTIRDCLSATTTSVPEPPPVALILIGALGLSALAAVRRRTPRLARA